MTLEPPPILRGFPPRAIDAPPADKRDEAETAEDGFGCGRAISGRSALECSFRVQSDKTTG